MIAGQNTSALGDKNDLYGALGRNGAQKTPEAVEGSLMRVGGDYRFRASSLCNLNADRFIADHS